MLTLDEKTYKRSSIARRNKLALANDGLARKVAHQMAQVCPEPYDDLLQLARIGLLKAVERFDPKSGNAFSSFAVPYIRGEIQHYLRDRWGAIKVPRRSLELVQRIRRIRAYMEKRGRVVTEEMIAGAIGLTQQKLIEVKEASSGQLTLSLDECLTLAFTADLTIERDLEKRSTWVVGAVSTLPEPQRSCLLEAFFAGIDLEAIALKRNVDEFQVKLWIQSALQQLVSEGSRRING